MKVKVEVIEGIEEPEITIKCSENTDQIKAIVDYLESIKVTLIGKKDGERFVLNLSDIYYFESVENRTFAYVEKDVYEVNFRIYELVEMYQNTSFIQASKASIVNIKYIKKISTLVNGRILVMLENGEKMIITRVYANEFKRRLGR